MSLAQELLTELYAMNVKLWAEGEQLRLKAPKGVLTKTLTTRISELKQEILALLSASAATTIPALSEQPQEFALSFQQERLWFLETLNGSSSSYHIPVALRLSGKLDVAALRLALMALQQKHSALRTVFVECDGKVSGRVLPENTEIAFSEVDLRFTLPDAGRIWALQTILQQETGLAFDIQHKPAWRACLYILSQDPDDYVLSLCFHHIIADGWSMEVIKADLLELYRCCCEQEAWSTQQQLSYVDYVAWQRGEAFAKRSEAQLDFWRQYLAAAPPLLEFPLDRRRPLSQSFTGAVLQRSLSPSLSAAIDAFGRAHGLTRFHILFAAWFALLYRYCGQQDIVLGLPVAGRSDPALERVVGFFVNTVAVRARIEQHTSFLELATQLKRDMLDVMEHDSVPFERVVEALGVARSLAHAPLFQQMFVYQAQTVADGDFGELRAGAFDFPSDVAKFDLTLFVDEQAEKQLTFEYSNELFEKATIARLADKYLDVLQALISDAELAIAEHSLVDSQETASILVGEYLELDAQSTVISEFERQVAQNPSAEAVSFAGESLSYAELDQRANRLARYLFANGLEKGQRVAVFLPRSFELVVAVLGVLKAGGAFVPLDLNYPQERLRYMVEDSGAKFLLVSREGQRFPDDSAAYVEICAQDFASLDIDPTIELPALSQEDLAYVIYTSGSTGKPKGVMIPHRGLVNYLKWACDAYDVAKGCGAVVHSTLAFDATLTSFFTPLIVGRTVFLLGEDNVLEALGQVLSEQRNYSLIKITPAHLKALSELLKDEELSQAVRFVVIGGEALRTDVLEFWYQRMPETEFVNEYGPTEAVVGCCILGLRRNRDGSQLPQRASVAIGKPIANTALYVLDSAGNPVAPGAIGELYIGGVDVGLGYLNREDLTKERFLPDPFSPLGNARMYRSGDLVRLLNSGDLDFLGRIDTQVKLNGYRIELEEIEAALSEVTAAAVVVVLGKDQLGRERLVGYVATSQPLDAAAVRQLLSGKLPSFMVPAVIAAIPELPLTANGKVDRKALPEIVGLGDAESGREALRGEVEQKLGKIWKQVLGIAAVGATDNFFDLGGDSIISLQVVSRARAEGLVVTVKDVFETQTIRALGQRCQQLAQKGAVSRVADEALTLLPAQSWLFSQVGPHNHYNQSVLLELQRPLPLDFYPKIAAALCRKHEVFKLHFRQLDGPNAGFEPRFVEDAQIGFSVVSCNEAADLQSYLDEQTALLQRSLNISDGPLARLVLFRSAKREFLFFVVHHLLIDTVSWHVLLHDFERAVSQLQAGEAIELGAVSCSALQWAQHLAQLLASGFFAGELPYWQQQVASTDLLLRGAVSGGGRDSRATEVVCLLSVEQTTQLLKDCHRAYRSKPDELLLTALAIAAGNCSDSAQLGVFLESHGRAQALIDEDISEAVGWFTSLYPLELCSNKEQLGDMQTSILAVQASLRKVPHLGLGFSVLKYLGRNKSLRSSSASGILFNYLGQVENSLAGSQLFKAKADSGAEEIDPQRLSAFSLEVTAIVLGGQLQLKFAYDCQSYTREIVADFAAKYQAALGEVIRFTAAHAVHFSEADLALAQLSRTEVEQLQHEVGSFEDVYPLSAMQEAMLFQSCYGSNAAEYIEQFELELHGTLDVPRMQHAWQLAAADFAALRTGVVLRGSEAPLQIVKVAPHFAWDVFLSGDAQSWQSICQQSRQRGFAFDGSLLMRFCMVQISDQKWKFAWTYHHLILDGWSAMSVFKRVLDYYRDAATAQPQVRPYRDYIQWLSQRDGELEYWKETLAGIEAPTQLRVGNAAVARATSPHYQELHCAFSQQESAKLSQFARNQRVTLSTVFSSAWALLLSRYSGERRVLFAETVSGRPPELSGVEEMVGCFINTLPVSVCCDGSNKVAQWLQELQAQHLQRLNASFTPLAQIQAVSDIPSGMPLFETLFVFENYPVGELAQIEIGGLKFADIQTIENTNFPLAIVIAADTEIGVKCTFDANRYAAQAIADLLGHLQELLRGFVANPDGQLRELSLLSAEQQAQQLRCNSKRVAYRSDKVVHQLFSEQAEKTPERVAVRCGEQTLTYAQLEAQANQLAHFLIAQGVTANSFVGLSLQPSLAALVAVYGVLKAGGAYAPIDPNYPPERIAYMAASCNAHCIVTTSEFAGNFTGQRLLLLDCLATELQLCSVEQPEVDVGDDNFFYAIFTSGTTGKPKPTVVYHRGARNLYLGHCNLWELSESDSTLLVSSLSFDLTQKNLFLPLLIGGCLNVIEQRYFDPRKLLAVIARCSPTWLNCTPSTFIPLLDADRDNDYRTLSCLRRVALGGEPVLMPQFIDWLRHDNCLAKLINSYGPTECTDVSHSFIVDDPENFLNREVPIGYPVDNVQQYVLDRDLNLLPIGVAGELYVAGAGVGYGYLGWPEVTAEKFLPNPFNDGRSALMYKTGDLVRAQADGRIDFLGRIDHQVKLRGYRIELAEIQAVLLELGGVKEALVMLSDAAPGEQQLVAYVSSDVSLAADALLTELRRRLPDYMVPAALQVMREFPLTPNRKVDRAALPKIGQHQKLATAIAGRDAFEIGLQQIWQSVLHLDSVGVEQNFFEIGGHSLLAIRVVAAIEVQWKRSVPIAALFENPTIAQLAAYLAASGESAPWPAVVAFRTGGSLPPLFVVGGAGGIVTYLRDLAEELGSQQPVYGLEPPGLDGVSARIDDLQELARYYVAQIKTVQPHGPYRLCGHSVGGKIAFEMSQIILAAGEEVEFLGILDACAPSALLENPRQHYQLGDWILEVVSVIEDFAGRSIEISREELLRLGDQQQLELVNSALQEIGFFPPSSDSRRLGGFVRVYQAQVLAQYLPEQVTRLPIHLFKTIDSGNDDIRFPNEYRELQKLADFGWGNYCLDSVKVQQVPGSHRTMLAKPYVQTLAASLNTALQSLLLD